ncbi:hypothetical protein BDV93DRAFT_545182, partial [Ceratobasidium sp. AG-I]
MFPAVFTCLVAVLARAVSANTVCSPSQCITGSTNVTISAGLSSVILLPGTYSSSSPAASLLPTSLSSLSASTTAGIAVSPDALGYPLTISLPASALAFQSPNYAGESTSIGLSSNLSSPRLPASLAIPTNMAITFRSASSTSSLVLFASTPDTAQLPSLPADLTFSAVQATSCTPSCASGGACAVNGSCTCAPGFAGAQCEQCAPGHFGPSCQQCADSCCEDGMTGSGKCLGAKSKTSAETCACEKGVCGSDGSCTCNPGWADASDVTAGKNATNCSVCAPGFFLDPLGECEVCSQGCSSCATTTGVCTTCKTGFTPDTNDRTRCVPTPPTSSTGISCADGQFLDASTGACIGCSPLCKTCTGPLSTQCVACGAGQFMGPGGRCVAVDGGGVCQGTKLVANNAKGICDACPSTCTSCSISSFSVVSTPSQITCQACLPGLVLTPQGKCASRCPAGTFVSPSDGFTCTSCDGSCAECTGEATFCTACASGGAFGGKCVGNCPSGTVLSQSTTANSTSGANTCLTCHADCASCSGPSNTQCTTCPPSRPLKSPTGTCLPASSCGAQSFFDTASSACVKCDASCSSCLGAGLGLCSACSEGSLLRSGKCVPSTCEGGTVGGLGICLQDLVTLAPTPPKPSGLSTLQIALIASSAVLLLLLIVLPLWRRRARMRRASQTAAFADGLPDTRHDRWDWGNVWRMGEAQRRSEEGFFGGLRMLGCGRRKGKKFHREMSLRKLGGGHGPAKYRDSNEGMERPWRPRDDREWRGSRAESSVVFERNVPFSDRGSVDSGGVWRGRRSGSSRRSGSDLGGKGEVGEGAYGRINPESHFAKTLAMLEGRNTPPPPRDVLAPAGSTSNLGSVKAPTPPGPMAPTITPNLTGTSAHTFGTGQLIGLSSGAVTAQHTGLASQPTGVTSQPTGTSTQGRVGNWMLPDLTGMGSVPSQYTGVSGVSSALAPNYTGTSSLASHYTGMTIAPRAPLPYAPFLSASTASMTTPQPRQPLRDDAALPQFALPVPQRSTTNLLMMSPPPQGIPSSPVWPGAVGGSYWFSEEQQAQAQGPRLGDKNPFRRF